MDLYSKISQFYRDIFPLNKTQSEFISGEFSTTNDIKLLDAGCALGDLAFDLYKRGFRVWAFDSNQEMIDLANKGKTGNEHFPVFDQLDMIKIDQKYPSNFFNGIICFGNTLVHLQNEKEISRFIHAAHNLLEPNGKLFIQILNYDYILENRIKELPLIETERIRFERTYDFQPQNSFITFQTILTIKEFDHQLINQTNLFPIRLEKLLEILRTNRFNHIEYFGNFKKEPLTKTSIPLIIKAARAD